ncbi:MAG: M48 family metallopeptidase [bacterium]|nr:M48 family metallopeptidase [bacterium]
MPTASNSEQIRRLIRLCGLASILVVLLFACQTVPVTGRKQVILISAPEENRMGITAYHQILQKEKLSKDRRINAMVKRVGQRIAAVANRQDFEWEFRVIEKDIANAFALPGGKVAVYTGILKYTQSADGLAVVMSHEVAHALARHGGERISRSIIAQLGLTAVQIGLRNNNPAMMQGIALAYGVGVDLPFNRGQESEADHIGLILMAKAGYDPREAIPFWQRMAAAQQSQRPPQFLSTHPSGTRRITQIKQWLPEAMSYYTK